MKTENAIVVNGNTTIIEFENSDKCKVRPSDLIIFTKEYLEYVPELLKKIKKSIGHTIELRITRMKLNGEIQEKVIMAYVVAILDEKTFEITTTEDMDSKYDYPFPITIRIDNPLGLVPTLPERDYINIYRFDSKELNRKYFSFLCEAKKILRSGLDKKHSTTLTYRFNDHIKKVVDCELKKVNKSNIEMSEFRSRSYNDGKLVSVLLGKGTQVVLNICPEFYLSRCSITTEREHDISPYDDGEEF